MYWVVWSQVKGLHQNVRNTLGISSIGPYWNLKSVNYFKESIHFCNFFIKNTSGKQKTLKTHTQKNPI